MRADSQIADLLLNAEHLHPERHHQSGKVCATTPSKDIHGDGQTGLSGLSLRHQGRIRINQWSSPMNLASNKSIFKISVLAGFLAVLAITGFYYWKRQTQVQTIQLAEGIDVASQIKTSQIPLLKEEGYATVIDLRPDGEAPDQPSATMVETAARANQMAFFYVPVPHGDKVPDEVVAALSKAMASSPKPILIYCRSGRRATRAWSLAEASRKDGLNNAAIHSAATGAGHSIDDLSAAITDRIARRNSPQGEHL